MLKVNFWKEPTEETTPKDERSSRAITSLMFPPKCREKASWTIKSIKGRSQNLFADKKRGPLLFD